MNKILLLASKPNASLNLLENELKKRSNIFCQTSFFPDLEFHFEDSKTEATVSGKPVSDFDLIYIITVGPNEEKFSILMSYIAQKHLKFIDPILANGNHYETCKLSQTDQLSSAGLPCLRTFAGSNLDAAVKFFNLQRPFSFNSFKLVAKDSQLDRGEGVFLITNLGELKNYLGKGYLIQEFISERIDLRIIVLGGKVIGCIHRIPVKGEFRANISRGGRGELFTPDDEIKSLAVKSAKVMNYDFAGVDILIDQNNKKYVLEVNRSPQYQEFMRVTGINVVKLLADFLIAHCIRLKLC